MLKIFQGVRPDVTPAQLVALFVAGVPVVANILHVFGVYDLSPEQQDALTKAIQWAGLFAIGLLGADAGLRASRGHAAAKVDAAAIVAKSEPPVGPTAAPAESPAPTSALSSAEQVGSLSGSTDLAAETSLPTDEEEFGIGGPDDAGDTWAATPADGGAATAEPGEEQGPESRLAPVPPEGDQL